MIKSLTINALNAPKTTKLLTRTLKSSVKKDLNVGVTISRIVRYQKLFYLSDRLKKLWYFLPNNGITPITKCTIKHQLGVLL